MSGPRKIFLNKTVLFVTTSIEEGLLFVPNPVVETILKSALARAQKLHPVKVCHFLFEATHPHLILVVDNPDDVKGFLERFKTETAHAANRLLGRKKRTVWCEGYDSPVVLTPEDTIEKIIYLYTNPAKDNLEDSIKNYPGLSSWKMYCTGKHKVECPWIHRDKVPCVKDIEHSLEKLHNLAEFLKTEAKKKHTLEIFPNAWMECFGITDCAEQDQINARIKERVSIKEKEYRESRLKEGKSVMGKKKLINQPMDPYYQPERSGKRMWCICFVNKLRKKFIEMAKELITQAREVYKRWKDGDMSVPFPLGLYPPSFPKLAEPLTSVALAW